MATTKPDGGYKLARLTLAEVAHETPIDFKAAAGLFAKRPSRQLLYRWRTFGILSLNRKVIRLGWFRDGATVLTTKEAVERFKRAANGE